MAINRNKKLTLKRCVGVSFKVLRPLQVLEALCKHCRRHSGFAWVACLLICSKQCKEKFRNISNDVFKS